MKRLLVTSICSLTLAVSVGATSCADGENPVHPAAAGGTNTGGGARGGQAIGGGQAGASGSGARGGSLAKAGSSGRGGSNVAGGGTAGTSGRGGSNVVGGGTAKTGGSAGQSGSAGSNTAGSVMAGRGGSAGQSSSGGGSTAGGTGALSAGGAPAGAGAGGSPSGGVSATGGQAGSAGGAVVGGSAGAAGAPSCQLVPQSGCPGGACDLDYTRLADGATTCRTIASPGTETNTCTNSTECAAGYLCVSGSCTRFCTSDTDCQGPGGRCVVTIRTLSDPPVLVPGVAVCSQDCDPMTSVGCPSGWGCGFYYNAQGSFTSCYTRSTGTQGATCTTDRDCARGYGCVTVTSSGSSTTSCLQYCLPSSPSCSGSTGTTCRQLNPAITIGTIDYGICN